MTQCVSMVIYWSVVIMAKFNHTAHKELWDWLSKNPDRDTQDWPRWRKNGGEYQASWHCFACEYDEEEGDEEGDMYQCESCPLEWPQGKLCCNDNGIHKQWNRAIYLEERTRLAEMIRDLPVREGVECI